MKSPITRCPPVRTISKKDALRHLVHAAIRMTMAGEDPFATNLIVQSADKLLIDLAKRSQKPLAMTWEEFIKPEYKSAFFEIHRETANFLKHADSDHDAELHVGHITEYNILTLAVCIANYWAIFGEWTDHMRLFFSFAQIIKPDAFVRDGVEREIFEERVHSVNHMTPAAFFADLKHPEYVKVWPNLGAEKAEDLKDNSTFFNTPMSDLAARREP